MALDPIDLLWITNGIVSLALGIWISRRGLKEGLNLLVFLLAILIICTSVVNSSAAIAQSHSLALVLIRVKDLATLIMVSLIVLLIGGYQGEIVFPSGTFEKAVTTLPILLVIAFNVLEPMEMENNALALDMGFGVYGIIILRLIWMDVGQWSEIRNYLMILGYCSFIIVGSQIVKGIFGRSYFLSTLPRFLDGLISITTFSFIPVLFLAISRFKTMDLENKRERVKPIVEPRLAVDFKNGSTFLFEHDENAFNVFLRLVAGGLPGLCVTRSHPEKIRRKLGPYETTIVWLAREGSCPEALGSSNIGLVGGVITSFLGKAGRAVVLLDGFEYLVANNGFEPTLKCLYDLNDRVAATRSILLLVATLGCFDDQQAALLQANTNRIPEIKGTGR